MGRHFRQKGQPAKKDHWRGEYKEIVKENALLEKYYNAIIPESEQEAFWTCLRTVLPVTFRLVGSEHQLPSIEGAVESIQFVPNAYKLPTSRRELRKDEQYGKLHQWLLKAVEAGTVCRQEAVSMVPPLCLKIDRPDLIMMDMCAAPGSKTGQMLEYLGKAAREHDLPITGMVIANDADKNRAFMLHHQVRRLHSPALLVTCNDASMYPKLYSSQNNLLLFDRVLCDVPCSGDGTLRKTPSIWASWSPHQAFGLHPLQRRILKRGLSMLKPGGRLVYSTCSLNPIEDEAVVASVLAECPQVHLVPAADNIPHLKTSPGRTSWSVMTVEGTWHEEYQFGNRLLPTFFPPKGIEDMNIQYTFRVLPHHQDTGGFYVAVFEKQLGACIEPDTADAAEVVEDQVLAAANDHESVGAANADDTESVESLNDNQGQEPTTPSMDASQTINTSKKQRVERFKFDQFHTLPSDSPLLATIHSHYFTDSQGPLGAYITRSADHDGPTPRAIVHCTLPVASIISSPPSTLRIVNAGVRAFERYLPSTRHRDDHYECQYRLLGEFLYYCSASHLQVKMVSVGEDLFKQLMETDSTVKCEDEQVIPVGGSVICHADKAVMSVWKTADGFVRPFMSRQDRSQY